jgi:Aldehyde dehydrogenase family
VRHIFIKSLKSPNDGGGCFRAFRRFADRGRPSPEPAPRCVRRVHVNGATVANEPHAPYGGMKNSGYGRFDGGAVIDEFTELKWVTIEPSDQGYPV